jgi:hypothetical protein
VEVEVTTVSWLEVLVALESLCILLFFGMYFGSLITTRGKELLFHGFIAGLVGAGLAVFDLMMRHLLGQNPEHTPPFGR